ncbi:MAG: hypothetical protein Q9170_001961 [Blastenia crenularia]
MDGMLLTDDQLVAAKNDILQLEPVNAMASLSTALDAKRQCHSQRMIGFDLIDAVLTYGAYQTPRNSGGGPLKDIFRRLWRFCPLVQVPHDVACLLNSGFSSASQIANTPLATAVAVLKQSGTVEENAVAIHDQPITVEQRNEQVWTAILASKSDWTPASIVLKNAVMMLSAATSTASMFNQVINYADLFGDIKVGSCQDDSFVTEPAAYFVDLLRMLKNALSNPLTVGSVSLLDKLFARRPDLKNSSFRIPAFNMDAQDRSADVLAPPPNVNSGVYTQFIAPQVFPMDVFPYSLAMNLMRPYFSALGSSRYEIMAIFSTKYRLKRAAWSTGEVTYNPAEEVIANAIAAEWLGMQHDDFIAITGSSLFPFEYHILTDQPDLLPATYEEWIGF